MCIYSALIASSFAAFSWLHSSTSNCNRRIAEKNSVLVKASLAYEDNTSPSTKSKSKLRAYYIHYQVAFAEPFPLTWANGMEALVQLSLLIRLPKWCERCNQYFKQCQ